MFYTDAVADIANGAKVLIIDPEDSTTGEIVEGYAAAHGVKVINYDRLTLGGQRAYSVSFNNVTVGTQLGQGSLLVHQVRAHLEPSRSSLVRFANRQQRNAL